MENYLTWFITLAGICVGIIATACQYGSAKGNFIYKVVFRAVLIAGNIAVVGMLGYSYGLYSAAELISGNTIIEKTANSAIKYMVAVLISFYLLLLILYICFRFFKSVKNLKKDVN